MNQVLINTWEKKCPQWGMQACWRTCQVSWWCPPDSKPRERMITMMSVYTCHLFRNVCEPLVSKNQNSCLLCSFHLRYKVDVMKHIITYHGVTCVVTSTEAPLPILVESRGMGRELSWGTGPQDHSIFIYIKTTNGRPMLTLPCEA